MLKYFHTEVRYIYIYMEQRDISTVVQYNGTEKRGSQRLLKRLVNQQLTHQINGLALQTELWHLPTLLASNILTDIYIIN